MSPADEGSTELRFEGSTVVVTGGAIGIGRAIAGRFAAEGATVVIAEIDQEKGPIAAEEIVAAGGRAEFVALDVSSVEAVREAVSGIAARHGSLDVMVNNAGLTKAITFDAVEESDWETIMSVNGRGVLFCQQAAAKQMVAQRSGSIINLCSISGKGWRNASNIVYAASKGAVLTMTRIAAANLAPHGVRVNCICPGVTETALFRGHIGQVAAAEGVPVEEVYERFLDFVPLRKLSLPEDIAAAAAFLASEDARVITGQSLNVDGGILND